MLNRLLRATMTKILAPVAHLFLRLGISPDVVTVVGTVGVCVGALAFFPRGQLWVGCLVITAFVFSDTVDGIMARESGRSSKWGAYLDSTLDRMGDSAIFGGLVLFYAGPGDNRWMAGLALACLILGSVVSYAKARAEGLGYTADVGIAERADRLVAVLVAAFFADLFNSTLLLGIVLGLLAVASFVDGAAAHAHGAPPGAVVGRGGQLSRTGLVGRATDTVSVLGFRLGWADGRGAARRRGIRRLQPVADIAVRRRGKGIQRLRANYRRARPELDDAALDALVREGMRSYMRYYCEAFRLPSIGRERLDAAVRVTGLEGPKAVADTGQAVVVFVGHLGNFDLAAAWAATNLAPVTTVAERLEPEEVFQEFVAFRNSIDMDIIPLTGGVDPFAGLLAATRAGGRAIALAADRDLTQNGIEVDLLGHRARMAKGPAVLALMTGAPLFCASIHYEPAPAGTGLGGYRTVIEFSDRLRPRVEGTSSVKAQDLIQQCADHLATTIRAHTSSWHMLQKVFVDDLDPDRDPDRDPGRAPAGVRP